MRIRIINFFHSTPVGKAMTNDKKNGQLKLTMAFSTELEVLLSLRLPRGTRTKTSPRKSICNKKIQVYKRRFKSEVYLLDSDTGKTWV